MSAKTEAPQEERHDETEAIPGDQGPEECHGAAACHCHGGERDDRGGHDGVHDECRHDDRDDGSDEGCRDDGCHCHDGEHDACHDHDACPHDECHGGAACHCHDGEHDGHHHDHQGSCCDDDCCCCEHRGEGSEPPRELAGEPTFCWGVVGLDCPHCAHETQEAVRALPGVADARLIYATASLEVVASADVDHGEVRRQVLEVVRSFGQDLDLSDDESAELGDEPSWWRQHRELVLMGASGAFLLAGLVAEHLARHEEASAALYVIAAVLGLVFVAPMAVASLRRRTADMNVLMAVAVLGALALGLAGDRSTFADAAIVIFLDQVGEWLEGWSMRRTSGSIRELMELAPDVAHLVDEAGETIDADVAEVAVGATIRVLPGERVPLDGTIVTGVSAFVEAAITGESAPADKGVGDTVFAGTLNTSGVVDVAVSAPATDSTLARVVEQVQGAQAAKAPYESFVDRFAAVYTPVVVGIAAVIGLAVPAALAIVSGSSAELWHDWVYRALSLLVVACPCALVISTPVSFVSAITRAAHDGVLVKGGAAFDVASRVISVALDKTGTLTTGTPAVTSVVAFEGASEAGVLRVARALESLSTHPLARAIDRAAESRGVARVAATDVAETAAAGVVGTVDGVACAVGKPSFVASLARLEPGVREAIDGIARTGATALAVASDGLVAGVIGVSDISRPEARRALAALHGMDVATVMLTGDHDVSAAAVAAEVGVSSFAANLLPEDKVAHIRQLQGLGPVAMVGDGINDAPALATADLGVTMGAAASDTALEVADVALLGDDLASLPAFFALARRTMRVVRANIAFAIAVKVAVLLLVVWGAAGMGAAVFADTGVALIVILNGMRLMLRA